MTAVSFGLVADVQFAFAPDRIAPGRPRFYQNSLKHLSNAVAHWNNEKLSFIVQLGDVIDGVNVDNNTSPQALNTVLTELDKTNVDVIHVLGNHELYNFTRQELLTTPLYQGYKEQNKRGKHGHLVRDYCSRDSAWYSTFIVKESPGFRFVVIDTFDESVLGRSKSSLEYHNALNIIRKHNNNENIFAEPKGQGPLVKRFIGDNGGIGREQLEWLDEVLSQADINGEKVVLFSHATLHPKCGVLPEDVTWNCEEVMEMLSCHPCVKVILSGHVHENLYHFDSNGIHHRTLFALLEADPNSNAFATVHLYKDKLKIEGQGKIDSQVLQF